MSFANSFAQGVKIVDDIQRSKREEQRRADMAAIANGVVTDAPPGEAYDGPDSPMNLGPKKMYLGQTFDTDPTADQMLSTRQLAMAGVLEKNGDAEGGLRYRTQVQQAAQQADATKRDQWRFGREQKQAGLQDEEIAKEKTYQTERQQILANSAPAMLQQTNAAAQAEFAQKQAKYAEDLKLPGMEARDLQAPVAPAQQKVSPGQMVQTYSALIAHDAKYGKISTEGLMQFGQQLQKLKDEGYNKALNLARSGASLDDVAKAFNASGDQKFDPKSVISDQMIKGPDGVPSRVIEFRGEDGAIHSLNTTAELDALGKADAIFTRFYQAQADSRDKTRTDLAVNADGRAATTVKMAQDAAKSSKAEKDAAAKAGIALWKQNNPNATAAEFEAARTGVLPFVPKDDGSAPNEVKLARAALAANMPGVTDMASALRWAKSKVGTDPNEVFNQLVTGDKFGGKEAVTRASETMAAMGYVKNGNKWGEPAAASKPATESDAHEQARAAVAKGADKKAVNDRLKSLGFKTID